MLFSFWTLRPWTCQGAKCPDLTQNDGEIQGGAAANPPELWSLRTIQLENSEPHYLATSISSLPREGGASVTPSWMMDATVPLLPLVSESGSSPRGALWLWGGGLGTDRSQLILVIPTPRSGSAQGNESQACWIHFPLSAWAGVTSTNGMLFSPDQSGYR